MHTLYDLRDTLCDELEEYGKKGDLTAGNLDVIDKLAHTIKNLDKIIMSEDDGYSGRESYGMPYYHDGGRSYARGRGRNAKRDSKGRYSRDEYSNKGSMVDQLYDLMNDAPDDRTRQEIQRMISKMENM